MSNLSTAPNRYFPVILVMLVALLAAAPSPAQIMSDSGRIPAAAEGRPAVNRAPTGADQAERLILMGQFERAIALLEGMVANNATDPRISSLLSLCYKEARDYGKLLMLTQRRAAAEPTEYVILRDLGEAYLLNGQLDSARQYSLAAIRRFAGPAEAMGDIPQAYQNLGQYAVEREIIDSIRVRSKQPTLLAVMMGDALAGQRRYGDAVREYLATLSGDTLIAHDAENRIAAMMRYPEAADSVMAVVASALKGPMQNMRLQNLYGQILMERDRYDEAFAFFRGRDSLQTKSGNELLYFMQECRRRGRNDYIVLAGTYFLQQYPTSSMAAPARFLLTDGLVAVGKYREAEATLTASLADAFRPADKAETHLRLGLLLKDHLGDNPGAENHLREAIRLIPGSRFEAEARMGIADVYIRTGRLDSALVIYDSLLTQELSDDIAEPAAYLRGMVQVFKGNYDAAREAFGNLLKQFPRGLYVNDAIQTGMILEDGLEAAPKQMDLFSAAEYYRYIGRNDSLEYYLAKICQVEIPTLAPVAYMRLGELYASLGRPAEAVAAADSLATRYPDSYFAPFGIKLKADILWTAPETKEAAAALYRTLLEKYSTYPFAAEIRDKLRRTDGAGQS